MKASPSFQPYDPEQAEEEIGWTDEETKRFAEMLESVGGATPEGAREVANEVRKRAQEQAAKKK